MHFISLITKACRLIRFKKPRVANLGCSRGHSMGEIVRVSSVTLHESRPMSLLLDELFSNLHHTLHIRAGCQILTMTLHKLATGPPRLRL